MRLRDNRFRQRDAAVLVDGTREIHRALAGGLMLRSLFIADLRNDETEALIASAGSLVVWVTPTVLGRIAYGDHPRDVVAVFDAPTNRRLEALVLPPDPLVVVLVGVEKPGNAGAVFRSADAVGADAVILCQAHCDLFNPNLIRSSLGTVFTMPSAAARQSETIRWLGEHKIRCFSAIVGAPRTFWQVDYRGPTAIVLGSEAEGLGDPWRPKTDPTACSADLPWRDAGQRAQRSEDRVTGLHPVDSESHSTADSLCDLAAVSIPMLGAADSLNVSVTAAALLFEARRQRSGVSDATSVSSGKVAKQSESLRHDHS